MQLTIQGDERPHAEVVKEVRKHERGRLGRLWRDLRRDSREGK